jgi:hypothetical protein
MHADLYRFPNRHAWPSIAVRARRSIQVVSLPSAHLRYKPLSEFIELRGRPHLSMKT